MVLRVLSFVYNADLMPKACFKAFRLDYITVIIDLGISQKVNSKYLSFKLHIILLFLYIFLETSLLFLL